MNSCVERIMTGLKVVSDEDLASLETDAIKSGFGDEDMLEMGSSETPAVEYEEEGGTINTLDISTDD
jgi:hypothetical protein